MKAAAKFSLFLFLASTATCLTVSPAIGQNARSPAVSNPSVAVVDVSRIFKNHARFKAAMDKMKQEVQDYEANLRKRHQVLAKERERLEAFRAGSPDYEELERSLANDAAQLQIDTQLKKKEFLKRESRVYYAVYQEVYRAVRQFAEQKGIDLVLRFTGDEIDPEDRASVLQGVNRPLVYHRNLDITSEILDRLNRTSSTATRGARTRRRQ